MRLAPGQSAPSRHACQARVVCSGKLLLRNHGVCMCVLYSKGLRHLRRRTRSMAHSKSLDGCESVNGPINTIWTHAITNSQKPASQRPSHKNVPAAQAQNDCDVAPSSWITTTWPSDMTSLLVVHAPSWPTTPHLKWCEHDWPGLDWTDAPWLTWYTQLFCRVGQRNV